MKRILATVFIILILTTIFSGCASKITQKDIQTSLENQGLTVSYNNELQEVNNGEFLINGKVKLGVGYYKTESQREEGKKTGEEYLLNKVEPIISTLKQRIFYLHYTHHKMRRMLFLKGK